MPDITENIYDYIVDHDLEEELTWEEYIDNLSLYTDKYFNQYQDWCESTALGEE
jgi:hypothetical protein